MNRVLKIPAFRRLLAAYTLNELAFMVGSLTLALLVYRRTGSALGAAGFFLSAQFVPALLSPLASGWSPVYPCHVPAALAPDSEGTAACLAAAGAVAAHTIDR